MLREIFEEVKSQQTVSQNVLRSGKIVSKQPAKRHEMHLPEWHEFVAHIFTSNRAVADSPHFLLTYT